MAARQITILRNELNSFTLVFDSVRGPRVIHELTYEEMLGCIAKTFVPSLNGEPLFCPKALFLSPPEPRPAGDSVADDTKPADAGDPPVSPEFLVQGDS